ncbi:MAG: glycosyltransferase family 9 protein, partial [Desulfomonilaceae bacterium]
LGTLLEMTAYSPILVFAHAGIGDTIMLLPLLQELQTAWRTARILCTVTPQTREVLELAGINSGYIQWPRNWRTDLQLTARGLLAVCKSKPEVVIVPAGMNLKLASLLVALCRADKSVAALPHFGGPEQEINRWQRRVFTSIFPRDSHLHKVEQFLQMLQGLDLTADRKQPCIILEKNFVSQVNRKLTHTSGIDLSSESLIAVHLGSQAGSHGKLWPLDRTLEVLEAAYENHRKRFLIVWGPGDKSLLEQAMAWTGKKDFMVPVPWQASISETAALLSTCEVGLSNDSGVAHLAAAVGTRMLAIFGPTTATCTGPYAAGSAVIFREVDCGPCYPEPRYFNCPHDRRCLMEISIDCVLHALMRVIENDIPSRAEEIFPNTFFAPSMNAI